MSPFSTHLTHITVLLCVVLPAWQYEHAIVMCIQLLHSIDTLVSFVTEAIEQVLLALWRQPVRTAFNVFVVCSALAVICELLKQFQKHVYVVPRRPRRRHKTRTQDDEVEVEAGRAEEQEGDRSGRRQVDEGTDCRERKEGKLHLIWSNPYGISGSWCGILGASRARQGSRWMCACLLPYR